MVKLGISVWVILFMLTFVIGCTSAKDSQTSVESQKASTESKKKSEETWMTTEVVTKDSKYSYKIPGDSKPLSKEFLGEISKGATETNGNGVEIEFKSGFSFNKENKSKLPLVVTKSVGKDDRMFNNIKEILRDYWVPRDRVVICENDKELAEAIQKNPVETLIISKNRNAVVVKGNEEIEKEKEKCTILAIMYMDKTSVAYFLFAEKENKFNDTLPLFLKIGETVAFAK
ncbi:hypothetical protein [Aneurinibacillus uraniidurans]|uniref:hypothetical protein n=1 Tax=Aneurinibacillus uraniidurans TaxID=2966586 RepID=UPI002349963B|nr:hypothetical protein [Aneurinibacillus sp. B1]WCN36512.1 hypothetical protein PO771_11540 [Aneurinibacillus sp. B1]